MKKIEKPVKLGTWWNDKLIEIYKIDGINIALYGWNGDKYTECFEVSKCVDNTFFKIKNINKTYEVLPIYKELENGDFETIDYIIVGINEKEG